ncbi:uncharacterized protein LOC110372198 [Helicoverpa armigera]|uniref:uncharacterized protein LOC110372198 n=1 Tax=Helicoverpa armigera TaxID=29058 RepID=UPI002112179E|nr:uncharacterized protein LOC110372132 isoform X1 [Helicoverpa armigera]XP_049700637.1 uncharacterized protein LOC110372198 isoform X1 [Helicoverpa armigera]
MKGELPVCTRCCFCFPLRRGLLAWGYIKLIADFIFILMMLYIVLIMILLIRAFTDGSFWAMMCSEVIMGSIGILICLVDIAITIVFIVGGHTKNVKLIRVFYIHSLVVCVVSAILCIFTILAPILAFFYTIDVRHVETLVMSVVTSLGILAIQCYFVLLLRSEIIKLNSNCEFRFVNNAAEAECTMKIRDDVPEEPMAEPILEKANESDDETVSTKQLVESV